MTVAQVRYAVVVSQRMGFASRFVELAARRASDRSCLVAVIFCRAEAPPGSDRRRFMRKLRKVRRIGISGAINGVRMRRSYGDMVSDRLNARAIDAVCTDAGIEYLEISRFGDAGARDSIVALDLDVALSLGNGYIPRSFFAIPEAGRAAARVARRGHLLRHPEPGTGVVRRAPRQPRSFRAGLAVDPRAASRA